MSEQQTITNCDHKFVFLEQIKRSPMRDYYKFYDVFFCEHCLKKQYVLRKTYSVYTGITEHKENEPPTEGANS